VAALAGANKRPASGKRSCPTTANWSAPPIDAAMGSARQTSMLQDHVNLQWLWTMGRTIWFISISRMFR
jgi:hypothetical protein